MNWQAIGAIGELVGGIAVIGTLIYLASQIRQNTKMNASAIRQSFYDYTTRQMLQGTDDTEFNVALAKAAMTDEELSPGDLRHAAVRVVAASLSCDLLSYLLVLIGRDLCEKSRDKRALSHVFPILAAASTFELRSTLDVFDMQFTKAGPSENGPEAIRVGEGEDPRRRGVIVRKRNVLAENSAGDSEIGIDLRASHHLDGDAAAWLERLVHKTKATNRVRHQH